MIDAVICAYLPAGQQRHYAGSVLAGAGRDVLARITGAFKAAPPEMTATEKATVEAAA